MPIRDIVIHFLEVTPAEFKPKMATGADVAFVRIDPPLPELNRFMYLAVGAPWYWIDRRSWTYAQWRDQLTGPAQVETWLITERGTPAGFVELEPREGDAIEIQYLGLLPSFIGRRLGSHLLSSAVARAFERGASKVLLNTCDMDHPKALANYLARGFREVSVETRQKDVPDTVLGPWEGAEETTTRRGLFRQTLAVVAYRGAKAVRGAPESFAYFKAGPTSRTPLEIVAHVGDLHEWALSMAVGQEKWNNTTPTTWDGEIERCFTALGAFDAHIAKGWGPYASFERLFAGPIADSLTHIGQLTMLRRLAGAPVKGENYSKADIVIGRVGPEQTAAKREFD